MDRFQNINTTGLVTTALFLTQEVTEANLLRRAILSEIETWAIDVVVIDINTTPRHDEIVAQRLGLLVIKHSDFHPPESGEFRTRIDITAPPEPDTFELTTRHIPEIPFAYETPIITMKHGQRLACELIVKKGTAKIHAKWCPVSTVTISEWEEGYLIRFKSVGMLNPVEILDKGLAKILDAARRQPFNQFARQVVPATIEISVPAMAES